MNDDDANTFPAALAATLAGHDRAMTPGPWHHGFPHDGSGMAVGNDGAYVTAGDSPDDDGLAVVVRGGNDGWSVPTGFLWDKDAAGVAALRNALPAIVHELIGVDKLSNVLAAANDRIRELRAERDAALCDVAALTAERDDAVAKLRLNLHADAVGRVLAGDETAEGGST